MYLLKSIEKAMKQNGFDVDVADFDIRDHVNVENLLDAINHSINIQLAGGTSPKFDVSQYIDVEGMEKALGDKGTGLAESFATAFSAAASAVKKPQPTPVKNQRAGDGNVPHYVEGSDVKVSAHFEIEDDQSAQRPVTGIKSQGKSAHR